MSDSQVVNNDGLYFRNPCNYPLNVDGSDLCAQWTSARAAAETLDWIPYQFWVDVAGVVGLAVSLIFSAIAAVAAVRAAHSAERSVDTYKATDRAWMASNGPISSRFVKDGIVEGLTISFEWRNVGNSPALQAGAAMQIETFDASIDLDHIDLGSPEPRKNNTSVIPPTTSTSVGHGFIPKEILTLISNGSKSAVLRSYITYYDCFSSDVHVTDVAFQILPHFLNASFFDLESQDLSIAYGAVSQHNYAT